MTMRLHKDPYVLNATNQKQNIYSNYDLRLILFLVLFDRVWVTVRFVMVSSKVKTFSETTQNIDFQLESILFFYELHYYISCLDNVPFSGMLSSEWKLSSCPKHRIYFDFVFQSIQMNVNNISHRDLFMTPIQEDRGAWAAVTVQVLFYLHVLYTKPII